MNLHRISDVESIVLLFVICEVKQIKQKDSSIDIVVMIYM